MAWTGRLGCGLGHRGDGLGKYSIASLAMGVEKGMEYEVVRIFTEIFMFLAGHESQEEEPLYVTFAWDTEMNI